jgi:threonine/homoserine/homoserine lactone efflux protein
LKKSNGDRLSAGPHFRLLITGGRPLSVATLSFLAFVAAQVGTPGPANMVLLATGARYGFRATLPFVAGVILGKQFLIWPLGFGLMQVSDLSPAVFAGLKWACVAYFVWLAWKIANTRLAAHRQVDAPPGFLAGLIVHPLNPKAWAMIIGGFTMFLSPEESVLQATLTAALCLLAVQSVLHPVWSFFGDQLARSIVGTRYEPFLMILLAGITLVSVIYALFGGLIS